MHIYFDHLWQPLQLQVFWAMFLLVLHMWHLIILPVLLGGKNDSSCSKFNRDFWVIAIYNTCHRFTIEMRLKH